MNYSGEQLYRKLLYAGKCKKKLDLKENTDNRQTVSTEMIQIKNQSNDCYIGSWNLNRLYQGYGI